MTEAGIDAHLQAGHDWLLGFVDTTNIETRIEAERARIASTHMGGGAAAYGPSSEDLVAAYLLLARASLSAPTNLDVVQASRVLPFLSAVGFNRDLLSEVENVEQRVRRWLSPGERKNPDSALFELLVAALYSRNGWRCCFLPETSERQTPDLLLARGNAIRWAECKRLRPRSQAAAEEKKHWRRIFAPLAGYMTAKRHAYVLSFAFHVPLEDLPTNFLLDRIGGKLDLLAAEGSLVEDDVFTVSVRFVDLRRIAEQLRDNYAKVGSPREIQLVTNEYRPTWGYTGGLLGRQVEIRGRGMGPALYWDEAEFAYGAYWRCDAPASISRKARDVRRHMARAAEQLHGDTPSAFHVGIETLDGELVENERYSRVLESFVEFDAGRTAMDWAYCHLFGPEAPPDKDWDFGETTVSQRRLPGEDPLVERLLVVPEADGRKGAVHW